MAEDKLFLLSLLMAEMGVHSVAYAFPRVRIITTAVDKEVNDQFHIVPGIGEDVCVSRTRPEASVSAVHSRICAFPQATSGIVTLAPTPPPTGVMKGWTTEDWWYREPGRHGNGGSAVLAVDSVHIILPDMMNSWPVPETFLLLQRFFSGHTAEMILTSQPVSSTKHSLSDNQTSVLLCTRERFYYWLRTTIKAINTEEFQC